MVTRESYSPAPYNKFITDTLETRNGIHTPQADGSVELVYPWAARGTMAKLESRRLDLQAQIGWALNYKDWHTKFSVSYSPRRIALVGTSGEADQVRDVLETYPQSEVKVIEIDVDKCDRATETLSRTNKTDIKSGRVIVVNQDAVEYLPTQAGIFDYVGADKVAIHLRSKPANETETPPRYRLYQAVEVALTEGGIFHLSDVHAKTWRVCAAADFNNDPTTVGAITQLKMLMPVILDVSWTKRDALLWEKMEDMEAETLSCTARLELVESLVRRYESPFTEADAKEGMVSKLIAITPGLGIEARRRMQSDNSELAIIAERVWGVAEGFIKAVKTPGVLIALPDYIHLAYRKIAT